MSALPPLHALRAFEAAARHLSFAQAAAELNLTPSAISHQIRHLEESLGSRLFERRHRSLELTPIGRIYAPLVRSAFDQLAQATALIGGAGVGAPQRADHQLHAVLRDGLADPAPGELSGGAAGDRGAARHLKPVRRPRAGR